MANFDFKKGSRRCFKSERSFEPGDEFYSVLLESERGAPERRDYGSENWSGPPESCIGWWKCRVPDLGQGRVYWAPKNVLMAYFKNVLATDSTADIAFVTALLLSQKRILKVIDNGGDETILRLRSQGNETYEVPVPEIAPARLNEIQDELSERLFMDQPVDPDFETDQGIPADSEE